MDALARIFSLCAIGTVVVVATYGSMVEWSLGLIVVGVLIASFFALLSRWAHSATLRETQKAVDATAKRIWGDVQEGKRPRFHLYLRPFDVTNKAGVPNRHYNPDIFSAAHYEEQATTDFESILEGTSSLPFIALGKPGEAVGAGRISTTDNTWWEVFLKLADAAEKLFVVPSDKSGTKREIEWITSSGNLKKCIFICPPRGNKIHIESNADWERAASNLWIQLPAYTSYGKLFRVDDNGKLVREVALSASNERAVSGAIVSVEGLEQVATPRAIPDDTSLGTLSGYERPPAPMNGFLKFVLIALAGMVAGWVIELFK